jgi:hypothetical protein
MIRTIIVLRTSGDPVHPSLYYGSPSCCLRETDQLGMITTVHANIKVRNTVLQNTAQAIALQSP